MKKNIIKILSFSLFLSITLLSCSEIEPLDETLVDYLNQESVSNISFSAMIDGQPFVANDITAFYNFKSNMITISGQGFQNSETLILNLKADGSEFYPLKLLSTEVNEFQPQSHSISQRYTANENQLQGDILISNFKLSNKTISGHFQGVLNTDDESQEKSITKGVFSNVSFVIVND